MPNPTGPSGTWTLVFEDEFSGTSLDTTRWVSLNGYAINGVSTCLGASANVTVTGGNLVLSLASSTSGAYISSNPADGAGANGWALPVGGCVEARIYSPGPSASVAYNWGGIFASGQSWPTNGEIDFWETLGSPSLNYHWEGSGGNEQSGPYFPSGGWCNGWHVTTIVRNATNVQYWWDGVLVQTYTTDDLGGTMSVLLCNGAGNTAAYGTANAVLVDYVRGWTPGGGGGTLSYRATPAVTQSSGGVTTFSVTKQSGTTAGDWILIYLFGVDAGTTACTGFTVATVDNENIGTLLYRLADGTEGSSFSITGLGGAAITATIATVAGATSSIVVGTPGNAGGSAASFGAVSITQPGAGWVLWFAGVETGFSGAGYAITPPSGYTSRATNGPQAGNATMMLADNETAASGATGTETGTSTSAGYWSGVLVGLVPGAVTVPAAGYLSGTGSLGTAPAISLSYRATPAVSQSSGGVTTFSVTKQSGTTAGDWILIYLFGVDAGTTACTGFTVATVDNENIGTLLYRLADGTEGSSFSITGLGGAAITATIATVAGATSSIVVGTPGNAGGSAASFGAVSITQPGAGWVLWFAGVETGFSGAGYAITPPSGYTSRATNGPQAGNATMMLADNETAASGATGAEAGSSTAAGYWTGIMVGLTPGTTVFPGGAALAGSGSMGGAWSLKGSAALTGSGSVAAAGISALKGFAALSGSGSILAAPVGYGNAALSGTGLLGGTAFVALFAVALSGSGTLGALGGVIYQQSAPLSGYGTLSLSAPAALLSGFGTLGISGERLGFAIVLSGFGTLSVPQVIGGLVSGVGGAAAPQALPGSSQVSVAPPGSANWQWIGTLGQVTALSYGYICPGGCDQMTMTVMVPAAYRTQLFNPGWQVRITRGGHQVWDGKLDEPVPSSGGWTLTAVGTGNLGTNFLANYTDAWPGGEPDESVNNAISRGLPWVNTGIGSPSGIWLGQEVDPGAQTVTALLTLICTRGGLSWYVNSQPGGVLGDNLQVFALPTVPTRLLVCTTPVARTLGGDVNTIMVKYMTVADNATSGAAAAYALTIVQNAQDVAAHGVTETYIDLSDVGVMSQAAAQAVASSVLQIYQRASFAGPFTASYGQLLTIGGQAIDPGTDQAGTVMQLILTDFGYGGEVTPQFPVTFLVGAYVWDDFAQVATITPYQNLDQSLTGMLSMDNTVMTPIAAAS